MRDFKGLQVWQKSHDLTLKIYSLTGKFPKEELYGLTSQMRRSSTSIATNIAEGCGRGGDAEFLRFLQISMGSASELEYQILLARDLRLLSHENAHQCSTEIAEVKKMLATLIGKIRLDIQRADS